MTRIKFSCNDEKIECLIDRLVLAGWVGRDKASLQSHIDELAREGVPAPTRTPIYMNFSPSLICTEGPVNVISGETSGEVEAVLIKSDGQAFLGVGSDHTDRGFEKYSVPASKHLYAKVLAEKVWPLEEVKDHMNQLILRSYAINDGKRELYQEGDLGTILTPLEVFEQLPGDDLPLDNICVMGGTISAVSGIVYSQGFAFEMEDPVKGRKIGGEYKVKILPQYV